MTVITKAMRERAWARAGKIQGEDSADVRKHRASGITMKKESFGKFRNFGWTVVDGAAVPCRKEFLPPRDEEAAVGDAGNADDAVSDEPEKSPEADA
ncbi:hypothetical protein [Thalassospira alkalitolerans]|uniref:hypothetical protein n=1 Tax=Thalassospira alkalitolerans TaxID=1293890 RepID=UPI003AA8A1A8|tara:strand:- start:61772 stop:62062 length:291 start_codon:yes stop_codon:yes gene_type:complete